MEKYPVKNGPGGETLSYGPLRGQKVKKFIWKKGQKEQCPFTLPRSLNSEIGDIFFDLSSQAPVTIKTLRSLV